MAKSISIALELDDKGFVQSIKMAEQQTKKFADSAVSGTKQASQGFDNLKNRLDAVSGRMANLTNLMLGAGFIAFARSALQAADNIMDISKSTDVAVPKLLQLQAAFMTNGGSAEGLNKILFQLNQTLNEAREGSAKAQEDLLKLGLSFKDMANMDTEQALAQTINKLSQMTDPIERNALAFRIFGKEAKGIDWAGIRDGTTGSMEEYEKLAESQRKAAEAQDKLAKASMDLTLAFTNVLEKTGILDFLNEIATDTEKAEKYVKGAGIAFGIFFGAQLVANLIKVAEAMKLITAAAIAQGVAVDALGPKWTKYIALLGRVAGAVGLALMPTELGNGELPEHIRKQQEEFAKLSDAQRKAYFDLNEQDKKRVDDLIKQGKRAEEAIARVAGVGTDGKAIPKPQQKPAVTPYYQKEVESIRQLSNEYEKAALAQQALIQTDIRRIGEGQNSINMMNVMNDATKKYNDTVDGLNEKIRQTQQEQDSAAKTAKIAAYKKEIAEITALYDKQLATLPQLVKTLNEAQTSESIRVKTLQAIQENQERLNELNDEFAKLSLNEVEKKYFDIEKAANRAAEAQIKAVEQERFGANAGKAGYSLSEEEKTRIRAPYQERIKAEQEAALKSYEYQRTFEYGWNQAFNKYASDATNAALQAQTVFNTFSRGFEDAMVQLVQNGKINFKSLIDSMIADLVRLEAKKLFTSLISNMGGGAGILGSLSGLFKAEGGPVSGGRPYIVGEKGPELFMPNTNGMVVPNNMLGGQQAVNRTEVTYNINAVDASSFRSLLASDPSYLYAVTEQGRRSQPSRRRV